MQGLGIRKRRVEGGVMEGPVRARGGYAKCNGLTTLGRNWYKFLSLNQGMKSPVLPFLSVFGISAISTRELPHKVVKGYFLLLIKATSHLLLGSLHFRSHFDR